MPSGSVAAKGKTKSKGSKGSKGSKAAKDSRGKEKTALSAEEVEKICFGRELYEDVDAVFVKRSQNLALFCEKIHIYEVWNRLPEVLTDVTLYGDTNSKNSSLKTSKKSKGKKESKDSKASKKKGSKSGSGKGVKASKGANKGDAKPTEKSYDEPIYIEDRPDMLEYERAVLVGAVAFPYCLCQDGAKIFVEVTANFVYYDYSKVPPFPAAVQCKRECYKDVHHIFPLNIDYMPTYMTSTQKMVAKVQRQYPKGWYTQPFTIDLTRKPDSVLFSRPYHMKQNTGLFWTLRAFVGLTESCIPPPENEVYMDFYKYTIVPISKPSAIRPSVSLDYNRWACIEDQGDLRLSVGLSKDVFYQGEEIEATVSIINDSTRHTVVAITVSVEQIYKLHSEIPHDSSIPLATTYVRTGEMGLPVGPKNKGWSNTFVLRPTFDPSKYNVAMDGRMSRDKKIFLAESTVIVHQTWLAVENLPPADEEKRKPEKPSKGSKGSKEKGSGKKAADSSKKSKNASKEKKEGKKGGKKGKSKGSKSTEPPEKPKETEKQPAGGEGEAPVDDEQCKLPQYTEVNTVTGRQDCRIIDISYEVVVRLTLGNEGGQPMVRVPFILTRNSRYIDRLPLRMPPVFAEVKMH